MFNIALLGKHGWRLLTEPDSLCARVLKGRYFPTCEFMQATVPKNSSATWRAIVEGREALHTGLIKRIGDGTTVSIWDDKWIPNTLKMTPVARLGDAQISLVSDLIDSENWTWKSDLVKASFIPPDADAILNIPLRMGGGDDLLAWAGERTGTYTVKSAYRSLMIQNEQRALEEGTITESSETDKQLWSRLWKLQVQPKVRVF